MLKRSVLKIKQKKNEHIGFKTNKNIWVTKKKTSAELVENPKKGKKQFNAIEKIVIIDWGFVNFLRINFLFFWIEINYSKIN